MKNELLHRVRAWRNSAPKGARRKLTIKANGSEYLVKMKEEKGVGTVTLRREGKDILATVEEALEGWHA